MDSRFKGFISYSHRDKAVARRLHRALEGFRAGASRARLGRIFRDDDEMAASSDLAEEIVAALQQAEYLIVLCSPHAAQSQWVAAEIAQFQAMGRGDRVIAVLLAGTPHARDPQEESLPHPLRQEGGPEPLAVNLRDEGQARTVTKIAARLLDMPFDTLWDRARRRQRRQRVALATAAVAALVLIGATVFSTWQSAQQRRVALLEEERRVTAALDDIGERGRLLAARAGEEADAVTAMLIALEAFTAAHPRPDVSFRSYESLPQADRVAALLQDWVATGHADPARPEAAALIRRGLLSGREIWSRSFPNGAHELDIDLESGRLIHATSQGAVTIETLDDPTARMRFDMPGGVVAVALAPGSRTAWIAGGQQLIEVDIAAGQRTVLAEFPSDDAVIRARFSEDRRHVMLSQASYAVSLGALDAFRLTEVAKTERLPSFAFQGPQVLVAAGKSLTRVRVADGAVLSSGTVNATLDRVIPTALTGADLMAFVVNGSTVSVRDNATGARIMFQAENMGSEDSRFAFDPISRWALFETGDEVIAARRMPSGDTATDGAEERLFCGGASADLSLDSAGQHVAAASRDGRVCVWSLPDLTKVADFETGRRIDHIDLRGDTIVTAFREGAVVAQQWRPNLAFQALDGCDEHLTELYFTPSGRALVGFGGFMGICVWDMDQDPPQLRHVPGLSSNGPWLHFPPKAAGETLLFVDRHGTAFQMTSPDMRLIREFAVPGEVFRGAGYTWFGAAVVGHTVDGALYLWTDPGDVTRLPVRLETELATADVFFGADPGPYLAVRGAAGEVRVFDTETGAEVLATDFPTNVTLAAVETVAGAQHLVVIDGDGIALDWPVDDLDALPRVVTETGRYMSGTYNPHMKVDVAIDVPLAADGRLLLVDGATNTRLLDYGPSNAGLVRIQSATLQARQGFQPRSVAILGYRDLAEAPIPMVAELPPAARDPASEDLADIVTAVWQSAPPLDAEPRVQVMLDYERRRAEDLYFRMGAEAAPRCLKPEERRALRLPADPPCWCDAKSYPPLADWQRALGRNPFTEPRADGTLCAPTDLRPWEGLTVVLE